MTGLIAFDMDGTLVKEESCWGKVHEHFGTKKQSERNLKAWENGDLDYREFMRRDIELWGVGLPISKVKEILSDYQLPPKAKDTFRKIRSMGHKTAIISGGLDVLAEKVARDLQIDNFVANGLETSPKGHLTGEGIFRVDPKRKSKALMDLISRMNTEPDRIVSVGDSVHDSDLFKYSDLGIAVGNDGTAAETADIVIENFENFDKILYYL